MRRILTIFGVLMSFALGSGAADLDFTPLHRDIQFSFGNPGARALGMGGAFLGRADDASAAEANPAGLTVISKRELTVEFRNRDVTTQFPTGNIVPGAQLLQEFRPISGKTSQVSFASFAMPVGPVVLSAYYHIPLDYEFSNQAITSDIAIPTICDPQTQAPPCYITATTRGVFGINYKSTVMGLAGGWQLGHWSLGAAAKRQKVDLEGSKVVGANTFRENSSESKNTFTGGIKWQSSNENFTVGGVYKKGATYTKGSSENCVQGVRCFSPFSVPDQYGLGMSLRWNNFTFNEDVVRVKYSKLLDSFVSETFCGQFKTTQFCTPGTNLGFSLPDATEVHFGVEYLIPRRPFAIRGGAWVDPAHALSFSLSQTEKQGLITEVGAVNFQKLQDASGAIFGNVDVRQKRQTHLAAGIGYLARSFEINAGYDHSSNSKTASISLLARF